MRRKNGNWTIKRTEKIFSNDFFRVYEDDVIQPDGSRGKYATIEFKNGVSILPVDEENNVYLTKQFRYALERDDLEATAGVIEVGEEILAAAQRETREELGIVAEEWIKLGKIEGDTSIVRCATFLYLARNLSFVEPDSDATEEIEIIKLPLEEALRKIENGEITHDLTALLIMKTRLFHQKN